MNNEVNFSCVYFNVWFFLTKIIELQIGLNRRCISGQYFIEFKATEIYFLGFSIINVSIWAMNFLFSSLESHKPCHTFWHHDNSIIFSFSVLPDSILFYSVNDIVNKQNQAFRIIPRFANLISDWYNHAGSFYGQELRRENKCNF